MRKLKFHYAKARNFLCFGPDGIELKFQDRGNIVLVLGQNFDAPQPRSNGTGKSSVPEILVYGIYGKTIKKTKKIKHQDVINNRIGKKLYTEVIWDDYRVVRTRKPDSLRLWQSEDHNWSEATEITQGSKAATQAKIEEIIGLNYDTFVNVLMFTDNNEGCFLECDTPEKRRIVENLMSLEKYRTYADVTKVIKKELTDGIKFMLQEYDRLLGELEAIKNRMIQVQTQEKDWKNKIVTQLREYATKIETKKTELESTKDGTALTVWQTAQQEAKTLEGTIKEKQANKDKLDKLLQQAREKYDELRDQQHESDSTVKQLQQQILSYQKKIIEDEAFIADLEGKKGTRCPRCYGVVQDENCHHARRMTQETIEEYQKSIEVAKKEFDAENLLLEKKKLAVAKVKEAIDTANLRHREISVQLIEHTNQYNTYLSIPRPEVDSATLVIENEIQSLVEQARNKKKEYDGPSPFKDILDSTIKEMQKKEDECKTKKQQIEDSQSILPYYDFWFTAFGDKGIRKFIIDGIIPSLNNRMSYWMEILFDGIIRIEFDNELNETIETVPSSGDPFVYHAMSGGERRSLNLSVAHSFAYVMMLSCGCNPSILWLDEVSSNIDSVGIEGIYNMIRELAKEKQVFITTHNQHLLELLNGCDKMQLEKRDGFTKLIK